MELQQPSWNHEVKAKEELLKLSSLALFCSWICGCVNEKKNPIIEAVFLDIMLLAIANIHSKNIHAYQVLEYGLESMF